MDCYSWHSGFGSGRQPKQAKDLSKKQKKVSLGYYWWQSDYDNDYYYYVQVPVVIALLLIRVLVYY